MRIALDTETTGLDLRHGARPFLVTLAYEDETNEWFEWEVDPTTRKILPEGKDYTLTSDLENIKDILASADEVVLQNAKFDVGMLDYLYRDMGMDLDWDWSKVRDTLLAGHLISSNSPHDLTTMVMVYLRLNVKPFDDALKECVMACRRMASGANAEYDWRIAKKGLPDMPSAKESTWKYDCWLPAYVAELLDYPTEHQYRTVCSDYANSDSTTTLALYNRFETILEEKSLVAIYGERLKALRVAYKMEDSGVTINRQRLEAQTKEYTAESVAANDVCVAIAGKHGYELTLPKAGNNKSLSGFVFGAEGLNLPPFKVSKKTKAPSLDGECLEHYIANLEPECAAHAFMTNLAAKRKRDTAIGYMTSYTTYWLPSGRYNGKGNGVWYDLFPSLNPTGTDTLRWSSSSPNEQNISKKEGFNLRYSFGPGPGREWWSLDANNIELRIPAFESGEQELIELFLHPEDPPYYGSTHLLNFHTVYEDLWNAAVKKVGFEKAGPYLKKKFASTWYQWCKNGGFAVQYGAVERENGTADRAFHRDGSHNKLKSRFSKLEALNQRCINEATELGYVETMPDKTVDPDRGYPLYCTRNRWGAIKPTVPLNYFVQGTAMWWMLSSMVSCQDYIDQLNTINHKRYAMILQVHDELVFDFPFMPNKGNLPKVRKLRRLMEQGGDRIGIPTPCSVEYHPDNWSEGILC